MAGGREVQVVYDQLRPRERPQVSTRFRTSCEVGACIRWCDAVWSWREASTRAQVVMLRGVHAVTTLRKNVITAREKFLAKPS